MKRKRLPCLMLAILLTLLMCAALAEDNFFDQTVFVGDSILRSVGIYQAKRLKEGESLLNGAQFLAADGYKLSTGSRKQSNPNHINLIQNGKPVTPAEGILNLEVKRAFVMLGLNDKVGYYLEKNLRNYERMITRILEANPGLDLIVLSVTPVVKIGQSKLIRQSYIDQFNQGLQALCEKKGVDFWDVSSALKDAEGYLNPDYSYDQWIHLNNQGIQALIAALDEKAGERGALQEGTE
ncbi:MAG: GDSL-type esterase/lipase family protein [Christensenellales bacterium]